MPRTSTLKAGAAALGLLIGFATAPESQVSLDRDVTPYTVAVVWREGGPPELPAVAGFQADDWGGRLAPAPRAKRAEPAPPPPARAKPAPRAEVSPEAAPTPPLAPAGSAVAAALAAPRPLCPSEEAGIREARAVRHHREVLGHADELTG